jgi:hypothetical protein
MMRFVLIAWLSVAPAAAISAQRPVVPGTAPRVTVTTREVVMADIPEANRRLLDVGRVRHRSVRGGAIGFVVGAAAGAFVGCLANRDDYGVLCGGQSDTTVLLGAGLGGVLGAVVGSRYL